MGVDMSTEMKNYVNWKRPEIETMTRLEWLRSTNMLERCRWPCFQCVLAKWRSEIFKTYGRVVTLQCTKLYFPFYDSTNSRMMNWQSIFPCINPASEVFCNMNPEQQQPNYRNQDNTSISSTIWAAMSDIISLPGSLSICSKSRLLDVINGNLPGLSRTRERPETEDSCDIRVVNEPLKTDGCETSVSEHVTKIMDKCNMEESAYITKHVEHQSLLKSKDVCILKTMPPVPLQHPYYRLFEKRKTLLEFIEDASVLKGSDRGVSINVTNVSRESELTTNEFAIIVEESIATTLATAAAATTTTTETTTTTATTTTTTTTTTTITTTTTTTANTVSERQAVTTSEIANTTTSPEQLTCEVVKENANTARESVSATRKYAAVDYSRTHFEHILDEVSEGSPSVEKKTKDTDSANRRVLSPRLDAGESQSNDYVETLRELTHLSIGENTFPTDVIVNVITKGNDPATGEAPESSITEHSTEEGSRAGTHSPGSSIVADSVPGNTLSEGSTTTDNSATSGSLATGVSSTSNAHKKGNLEMDCTPGNRSPTKPIAKTSPCPEAIDEGRVTAKASACSGIVSENQTPTNNRITPEGPENSNSTIGATANNEATSVTCSDNIGASASEVLATNTITAEPSVNRTDSIASQVSIDHNPAIETTAATVTNTIPETQPANTQLDAVLKRIAQGEEIGPRTTMRFELLRLCTMRNYPKLNKPSLIRLAGAGFYYAADGDEVICYCCGIRRRNWTSDDIPMDVHRRTSPRCSFILNNAEVNIRVPQEENSSERPDRFANLQELLEPVSEAGGRQTGRDGDMAVTTVTRAAQQNGVSDSSHSVTARPTRPNSNVNRTPKHPHYGAQSVRLNSFVGWPATSPQTPTVLAEAGFYYAGMGDCVRCYHCSVGLRHWAAEDDPWIEHGRWTLENPCWYLLQKRGEEFLDLIRMALQLTDNQPQPSANTEAPSEFPPTDTGSPAPTMRSRQVGAGRQSGKPVDSCSVVARGVNSSTTQMRSNSCSIQSGNMSNQPKTTSGELPQKGGSSNKLQQLKTENQQLRRQTLCHVCEERDVCIVFLPCGHLVTCSECAPQLRVCPVCNKTVKGTVRTYMS